MAKQINQWGRDFISFFATRSIVINVYECQYIAVNVLAVKLNINFIVSKLILDLLLVDSEQ